MDLGGALGGKHRWKLVSDQREDLRHRTGQEFGSRLVAQEQPWLGDEDAV
jgi:hypothetical protein